MLSAMNLSIIWGDNPQYWQWYSNFHYLCVSLVVMTRWDDNGQLLPCVMKVWKSSETSRCMLVRDSWQNEYSCIISKNSSAYIVFKKVDKCYGFQNVAIEAAVGMVGQEPSRRFICFSEAIRRGRRNVVKPKQREDGWMEIELGEFFNEGGLMSSDEIEMSALENKRLNWMGGLIIQGIEIRPAKSPLK